MRDRRGQECEEGENNQFNDIPQTVPRGIVVVRGGRSGQMMVGTQMGDDAPVCGTQEKSLSRSTHSRTLCICNGWRYGLECGVWSLEEGVGRRRGLEGGVKSPGLEEGVLSAVFDMVAESIVQIQQRRRHYG